MSGWTRSCNTWQVAAMISNALTLKQLEALIWVADLGSFRKAAQHLNTTQPNISSRIGALEKAFGITLMHRDAGSVRLTAKGAEFLQQARRVVAEADMLLAIAGRQDMVNDRLRLGVTELVAYTWLRDFVRAMNDRFPNVAVELTIDFSRNLDKQLAANELDLALQTAPFGTQVSGSIPLGTYDFCWVAAPEIAAVLPQHPTDADLASQVILAHARHTHAYAEISDRFAGLAPRIVPSNSLLASLHMAVDGMGIAPVPAAMVGAYLENNSLVVLDAIWCPSPLRLAARYHKEKAQAFVKTAAQISAQCAQPTAAQDK